MSGKKTVFYRPPGPTMLIVIDSKYFYAAVELDAGNHVCRCAPIVNFMKGWSERRVLRFVADRKWTAHVVGSL